MKRSCTSQWPCQVMIFDLGLAGDILGQIFIRQADDFAARPAISTICTALADVQQISTSAFTSAEVLT